MNGNFFIKKKDDKSEDEERQWIGKQVQKITVDKGPGNNSLQTFSYAGIYSQPIKIQVGDVTEYVNKPNQNYKKQGEFCSHNYTVDKFFILQLKALGLEHPYVQYGLAFPVNYLYLLYTNWMKFFAFFTFSGSLHLRLPATSRVR